MAHPHSARPLAIALTALVLAILVMMAAVRPGNLSLGSGQGIGLAPVSAAPGAPYGPALSAPASDPLAPLRLSAEPPWASLASQR